MKKTVATSVYALASDWLADREKHAHPADIMNLAAAIQTAIEDWCEDQDRAAEQANDPHERAAARARANNFAETGGKDWT